jgi:palmitoyltransferase ZDHHC13/17
VTCNILSTPLCHAILPDPFTVVLALWTSLQLIWVTMLLIVQLVQIARAQTTYENMRGHDVLSGSDSAAAAITSALATGSTSLAGGGLGPTGMGPNPNISHSHPHPKKKSGFFNQWKKLLGLDTFVATAQDARAGSRGRRQNAFSRGILTNCRDFWCDPAHYFGKRENGQAMLGGEVINYGRLYDVPLRLSGGATRRRGEGMEYRMLAGGDEDEGDGEV